MNQKYLNFKNMYKAANKCCNNVRWKTSVTQFEMNKLKNTTNSIRNIKIGKYKLSKYQTFTIYEPKLRSITATRIIDRQIQRSLCDTTVYNLLTKSFIYSNAACQKGKGTDFALKDFKKQLQKHYRKFGNTGYYLKCDIHHFFENILHDVLKEKLRKHITDEHILFMLFHIIDSFGEKGLGLGSQVSQLLALFYLDELDHKIKEFLHIKVYTRYMDDFILVSRDKEQLKNAKDVITQHLNLLGLTLNDKTTLQKLEYGVNYLNWRFLITDTGKVLMLPSCKRNTKRRHKLQRLMNQYKEDNIGLSQILQITNSMKAHLGKGNAYKSIIEIDNIINNNIRS